MTSVIDYLKYKSEDFKEEEMYEQASYLDILSGYAETCTKEELTNILEEWIEKLREMYAMDMTMWFLIGILEEALDMLVRDVK